MRFRLRILPSSVRAGTRRQANSLFASERRTNTRIRTARPSRRWSIAPGGTQLSPLRNLFQVSVTGQFESEKDAQALADTTFAILKLGGTYLDLQGLEGPGWRPVDDALTTSSVCLNSSAISTVSTMPKTLGKICGSAGLAMCRPARASAPKRSCQVVILTTMANHAREYPSDCILESFIDRECLPFDMQVLEFRSPSKHFGSYRRSKRAAIPRSGSLLLCT